MGIEEFRGYLGFTSQGVIALHADWPTYPLEHGVEIVLISLGSFPEGTTFSIIDDIDRCALFVANEFLSNRKDLFDERNFHVAIWHQDLLAAERDGFIRGTQGLTEREYQQRRYDELRESLNDSRKKAGISPPSGDPLDHIGWVDEEGIFHSVEMPSLDTYAHEEDDDLYADRSWLGVVDDRVQLTPLGWRELERLWAESIQIPDTARTRVEPLIAIGRYDTALREVGAVIETQMRAYAGLDHNYYGTKLVEAFIAKFQADGGYLHSGMKTLRGELRTAMKFVRNEFAHQAVELSPTQGMAILSRMCHALYEIEGFQPLGPKAQEH